MVALAVAAMPSSRPVKPSRSLVVAFTATREMSRPEISAIRARMVSRSGPIFGRSQIKVTSRLAMRPPRAVTRSTAYFRKRSEDAPFHCGSLGGKCEPISPSASAPRMASTSACRPTSPSEWARKPLRVRHANAADHHMIAVAEGVYVIAGAGPDVAELACKARFLADEIFGRRQLHVEQHRLQRSPPSILPIRQAPHRP